MSYLEIGANEHGTISEFAILKLKLVSNYICIAVFTMMAQCTFRIALKPFESAQESFNHVGSNET